MSERSIEKVMALQEAACIWGKDDSNLRREFIKASKEKSKSFKSYEVRKSGRIWLVEKSAMDRVYGFMQIILENKYKKLIKIGNDRYRIIDSDLNLLLELKGKFSDQHLKEQFDSANKNYVII